MNSDVKGTATSPTESTSNSSLPTLLDVTGWPLTAAQAALEPAGCLVHIIETGPPQRKRQQDSAPQYSGARKPVRVPVFGEWRVLRSRVIAPDAEPAHAPVAIELLVARELLGETHTGHPAL